MVLRSTSSKPFGKVLKTNCTTPLNTTFDHNNIYLRGNGEGDGSSDIISYHGHVYGYVLEDVYWTTDANAKNYYMPQLYLSGLAHDDNDFIDWDNISNGSTIQYPIHRRSPDRVFTFDKTYELNPINQYTLDNNYEKES